MDRSRNLSRPPQSAHCHPRLSESTIAVFGHDQIARRRFCEPLKPNVDRIQKIKCSPQGRRLTTKAESASPSATPVSRLRNAALRRGRNARQEEPVTPCFGPRLRFSRVDSADILSGPA